MTVRWCLVIIILSCSCQNAKIILMFVGLQVNRQISFCCCWISTNFTTIRFITAWIGFASCQSRVRSRFTTKSAIWISFISGCHYNIATGPIATTFTITIFIIWFHFLFLIWFDSNFNNYEIIHPALIKRQFIVFVNFLCSFENLRPEIKSTIQFFE